VSKAVVGTKRTKSAAKTGITTTVAPVTGSGSTSGTGASVAATTDTTTLVSAGEQLNPATGHSTTFWLLWIAFAAVIGGLAAGAAGFVRRRRRDTLLRRRMAALAAEMELAPDPELSAV